MADLEADYQPATETEALLVHDLAKFHWLADRAIRLQAVAFAATALPEIPVSLNVLIRYQTSSPPVQQIDAGSKTQRTQEFVSQPPVSAPEDTHEFPIGPPEGYFDGHALQALYYAEMNALEEQERKQPNERYLEIKKRNTVETPIDCRNRGCAERQSGSTW